MRNSDYVACQQSLFDNSCFDSCIKGRHSKISAAVFIAVSTTRIKQHF